LARELEDANEELTRINHELEQRVEEKTREVLRNLNILQVSQEVLERLPVAVIGVGDDGIIAIANQSALRLFSRDGVRPVLGETASDVIPPELLSCALGGQDSKQDEKLTYHIADGRQAKCWCCPMGEISQSKGVVLVIDADI
jgi:nitrogen fixation/metabolism regulation signal transduction histidine kinase